MTDLWHEGAVEHLLFACFGADCVSLGACAMLPGGRPLHQVSGLSDSGTHPDILCISANLLSTLTGQPFLQAYHAVENEADEGGPQDPDGQMQSGQAAAAASAAAPARAPLQVRSLPPHLHAAKRPPAGPPSKPPQPRPRPAVIIPPPNAWPTAPLHLPGLPRLCSQIKPEQQQKPEILAAAAAVQKPEAEQPQASEVQHATAWASFQQNAAISMQRAHSLAAVSAPEKPPSSRRSLDSMSPFASASQEGPDWSDPGDLPTASIPVPAPLSVRGSMERDSSLKNISSIASLRDWGASKGVPRRVSTERLPSLQDWMLPLCISSPPSSGPKCDAMSRTCSQDLLCSEAMPRAEHFLQWACSASVLSASQRPSHDLLERMPNALPETLPLTDRSDSLPKRSRGCDTYVDDSPTAHASTQQRPKSPRLARSALSASFTLGVAPRCARSGSPHSGGHSASTAGCAGCSGPLDSLWGAGNDGTRLVRLPSPTTAT